MKPVLLDNNNHLDLRIVTTRGAAYGDDQMSTPVFLSEFRGVQACYPIVFQPADNGPGMQPMALLGLRAGENLFLDAHGWDAPYIPLALERGPFMIGRAGDELMIHVDLDSPRIGRGEGEARVHAARRHHRLPRAHELGARGHPRGRRGHGRRSSPRCCATSCSSRSCSTSRPPTARRTASPASTRSTRSASRALDAPALAELHAQGWLAAIYMVVASMRTCAT